MTLATISETAAVPDAPPRGPLRFDPSQLPAPRNPYLMYISKHPSPGSRRRLKNALDLLAEMLSPTGEDSTPVTDSGATIAWWTLRYEDAEILRSQLIDGDRSARTVNVALSALRGVLKTSQRLGLMSAEAMISACDVKTLEVNRLPAGRHLPDSEISALLSACVNGKKQPLGVRDAAIIAVLAATGARREEVAEMLIENFDASERSIRVIGKGNKEREVNLHEDAVAHLDRWLVVLGENTGPIFRAIDRENRIKKDRPLTGLGIGNILKRRLAEAGIRALTAHDFRRTIAGNLLDAGVDLVTVQEILGHADPTTTAKYDRRPGRKRRAAIDKLHLPRPEELLVHPAGGTADVTP